MLQNQVTGMIEVIVDQLLLLNAVETKLPFQVRKFNKVSITNCVKRMPACDVLVLLSHNIPTFSSLILCYSLKYQVICFIVLKLCVQLMYNNNTYVLVDFFRIF